MIEIISVVVNKSVRDTFQIQWDARRAPASSTDSVNNYNFYVMFSENPESGFSNCKNSFGVDIVIDGSIGPLYSEVPKKDYNRNRDRYFRIRAIHKTNPAVTYESDTVSNSDKTDGVIKTIEKCENILNRLYIGDEVYISKRKTDGSRCPECWNPYQYRRTKTNCTTCRGTGFIDGFYSPITGYIAFDKNPKVAEQSQTGEIQSTNIKARSSSFPLFTPRDMVTIKSTNDRYSVISVDFTKLPNISCGRGLSSGDSHIVSQIITMSQLYPSDPKFGVVLEGQDVRGAGDLTSPTQEVSNV